MANLIDVLIVVDVNGALSSGNLFNNVYLIDNNSAQGSQLEGNAELQTACSPGQVINWRVVPVDPTTTVSIVSFAGNAIPNVINPTNIFNSGIWAGTVASNVDPNVYWYTVTLLVNGQQMTFDPWLNTITPPTPVLFSWSQIIQAPPAQQWGIYWESGNSVSYACSYWFGSNESVMSPWMTWKPLTLNGGALAQLTMPALPYEGTFTPVGWCLYRKFSVNGVETAKQKIGNYTLSFENVVVEGAGFKLFDEGNVAD